MFSVVSIVFVILIAFLFIKRKIKWLVLSLIGVVLSLLLGVF